MMDDPRDAEEAANALPLNLEAEQALLGQLMFDNVALRHEVERLTKELQAAKEKIPTETE